MSSVARLMIDPPQMGSWNMAVDQVLLESAETSGHATLRIYRWKEPTLSLGYFQSYADRRNHDPSQTCRVVRRKTGGGAILHHHDLTYSLTIPNQNRWSQQNESLYRIVHQALIEQWATQGVQAGLYGDSEAAHSSRLNPDSKAFLCFQRRSSGDIVYGESKITGSAQRRLKRSLLQHGSILIRRSEFAPELTGLEDQVEQPIDWKEFQSKIIERLGSCLHLELSRGTLSDGELSLVNERQRQFEDKKWLMSR